MAKLVYIASPYTGNEKAGTEFQIDVANRLREHGYLPYWPLCSHYWNAIHHHPYEYWMDMDYEWIGRCDALLRMGGDSRGAALEVAYAISIGVPVFYSVLELLESED